MKIFHCDCTKSALRGMTPQYMGLLTPSAPTMLFRRTVDCFIAPINYPRVNTAAALVQLAGESDTPVFIHATSRVGEIGA